MDEGFIAVRAYYDGRLAGFSERAQHLLGLPPGILLDPLRATDETGKLLPEAVSDVASGIERHLNLSVALPRRSRWNMDVDFDDLDRDKLRAVCEDIDRLRHALATQAY